MASPALSGTVSLVTGASSGIGEATAGALAKLGSSVAIVARRRERLERLAERIEQEDGHALVAGIDDTFSAIQRLSSEDIADAIAYIVTRPRHVAINELLIRPSEQQR